MTLFEPLKWISWNVWNGQNRVLGKKKSPPTEIDGD